MAPGEKDEIDFEGAEDPFVGTVIAQKYEMLCCLCLVAAAQDWSTKLGIH